MYQFDNTLSPFEQEEDTANADQFLSHSFESLLSLTDSLDNILPESSFESGSNRDENSSPPQWNLSRPSDDAWITIFSPPTSPSPPLLDAFGAEYSFQPAQQAEEFEQDNLDFSNDPDVLPDVANTSISRFSDMVSISVWSPDNHLLHANRIFYDMMESSASENDGSLHLGSFNDETRRMSPFAVKQLQKSNRYIKSLPQILRRYRYASNGPITFTTKTGHLRHSAGIARGIHTNDQLQSFVLVQMAPLRYCIHQDIYREPNERCYCSSRKLVLNYIGMTKQATINSLLLYTDSQFFLPVPKQIFLKYQNQTLLRSMTERLIACLQALESSSDIDTNQLPMAFCNELDSEPLFLWYSWTTPQQQQQEQQSRYIAEEPMTKPYNVSEPEMIPVKSEFQIKAEISQDQSFSSPWDILDNALGYPSLPSELISNDYYSCFPNMDMSSSGMSTPLSSQSLASASHDKDAKTKNHKNDPSSKGYKKIRFVCEATKRKKRGTGQKRATDVVTNYRVNNGEETNCVNSRWLVRKTKSPFSDGIQPMMSELQEQDITDPRQKNEIETMQRQQMLAPHNYSQLYSAYPNPHMPSLDITLQTPKDFIGAKPLAEEVRFEFYEGPYASSSKRENVKGW